MVYGSGSGNLYTYVGKPLFEALSWSAKESHKLLIFPKDEPVMLLVMEVGNLDNLYIQSSTGWECLDPFKREEFLENISMNKELENEKENLLKNSFSRGR